MMGVHRQAGPSQLKNSLSELAPGQTAWNAKQAPPKPNTSSTKPPAANSNALDYDVAQELADLPSDAFSSSSGSPQKLDDDFEMVAERRTRLVAPQSGLRQTTLFGRGEPENIPPSQVNKRYSFVASQKHEPPTHHKLDDEALKTWVYPTNLGTIRDYQFNIAARGLFHNLLVALPTGLGKTFIAATIMLNWFRWTKDAQIVFVAPTKPLVTQQVEACFNIVGIPRSLTSLLTGNVAPGLRAEEWTSKRVFFMTPQTMINDLKTGICDPKRIVLLVVDEAHKATGNYAYVEAVKFIRRFNESFRVLALTATPGADIQAVQTVIDSLEISRVEIRTEQSLDIRNYVFSRKVEKHVFNDSDEMEMCKELYSQAVRPVLNMLASQNASWTQDPIQLTPYGCTKMRQKWMAEAGRQVNNGTKYMVNNIFSILGSLSQSMELLKYHGIRPFYTKLQDFRREQSTSKFKKQIVESDAFTKLMNRLGAWTSNDAFTGHPKLDFLLEAVLAHFVNAAEGQDPDGAAPAHTRIMVFAHFRDSAEEIVRFLKRHEPMIRPQVFVGQSHAKNSEGMDQKKQQSVIEDFKMGKYNTLVATSIGEEGLDIGDVDLIVCYDSKASPLRMLQRMGRTGRKREGRILLLQMKGKEEDAYFQAKDAYETMQELIANGSKFTFHDDRSRRIIPKGVQPVVDKRQVDIPLENSQTEMPEPRRRGRAPKRPPKKFHMPDNVITGFVSASNMDQVLAPGPRGRKKAAPVYPSEELVNLDPLESVLLNDQEIKELESRYQTVYEADDDAPMVAKLDIGKYPDRQREMAKSRYFSRPSWRTQGFVKMMQRMHTMDYDQLEMFQRNVHHPDREDYPDGIVVGSEASDSDHSFDKPPAPMKASPKPRAKPGPKPNTKVILKELGTDTEGSDSDNIFDKPPTPMKAPPKPRARAAPKHEAKIVLKDIPIESDESDSDNAFEDPPKAMKPPPKPKAKPGPKPKVKATPKTARAPKSKITPKRQTYRISDAMEEAESSSPPPTDPRMRLASQAESLGSEDTVRSQRFEDTQAYRLDSDLVSFIAEDDEDVDVPSSSLPTLDFNTSFGLGKGTQAVLASGRKKQRKKAQMEKIFTSDVTDVQGVVSSDSEEDLVLEKVKRKVVAVGSDTEDDEDEPPIRPPTKRARRVIVEDDDEDG
jgi:ATP-dependent DNA helicase MPH1